MKRNYCGILHLILAVSSLTSLAFAQVSTGAPRFGSFGGGPFDVINLGNLNTHFVIPVLHKPGRAGLDFAYDLSYDSSIWRVVTSNGTGTWQPASNAGSAASYWGWAGLGPTFSAPFVTYSVNYSVGQCGINGQYQYQEWQYGSFVFYDAVGSSHAMGGGGVYYAASNCPVGYGPPNGPQPAGIETAPAYDNSGYTINLSIYQGYTSGNIVSQNGTTLTLPFLTSPPTTSSPFTSTDSNGNQITLNNGAYTDTLGQNVLNATGAAPNPISFAYIPPANENTGTRVSVTVNFVQYTVKTGFGAQDKTGHAIGEYGPSSIALVDNVTLPDGSRYQFAYERTPGSCTPLQGTYSANCVTARIASVSLPTGGTITYLYTGGYNGIMNDGSTSGLTRILSNSTTCSSSTSCWQYSRSLVSGLPGPASTWKTTVVDPAGNNIVANFAEDSSTSPATYNFYETQRATYQGSVSPSNLLLTGIRCYNGHFTACAAATVASPISKTDTYTELPNGTMNLKEVGYSGALVTFDARYKYGVTLGSAPPNSLMVRSTNYTYMGLGKPTQIQKWDWTSGSPVSVGLTNLYYDVGTPTSTPTCPSTGCTPHHVAVSGARGNLTSVGTQANTGVWLYQAFTYYDTGMLSTSTGASTSSSVTCSNSPSICTTYNYSPSGSCGNSFVTSVNEPMSLTRSMAYDSACVGGELTSLTDEDSNTANVNYNDAYFWRPASVTDPLSNIGNVTYTPTTAEAYMNFNGTTSTQDVLTTVDGFGRPNISQQRQAQGSSSFDSSQATYGWTATGSVTGAFATKSVPYAATAGQSAPGGTATTTTQHDALGRISSTTDGGGGNVSYSYSNGDVLQTIGPTRTFQKQFEYDGLGRLSSVCEVSTASGSATCGQTNSKQGFWTRYKYDALDRLIGVCQNTTQPLSTDCVTSPSAGQQTRTYSYDMLGRITSETNPETGNSSPGTVAYTYDAACGSYAASAGDLTKRVDNASNTTCYAYDTLHRLTDAGNTGPICRHFRYDSQTPPSGVTISNTLGRTAEAYTDNCSGTKKTDEWFSYDAGGHNTGFYEWTANSGGYYHTQASFWANGGVKSLSALNSSGGSIIPTIYYGASDGSGLDGEGRITKVTASSGTNPASGITYAATNSTTAFTGLLTGLSFPSGDSDSFTYDPSTGRQQTYTFSVNGATDKGTMTWNPNGTLGTFAIADNLPGAADTETCNYFYDDMARLGGQNANGYSVDCGSKLQQLFTFDAFGNIKKSGAFSFNATYNTATNHISGMTGVQYDNNGNLTQDNLGTQYTWDPNWGNPASINTTNLIYDAQGQMVEQQNGSTYTQMLYSQIGKTAIMNGQGLQKAFVPLPGGATAIFNASGTLAYYRHADWLGNSRLTTTPSRTVYSTSAYAPFGEQYATSGTADPSFTGQNSDTNSNLYDFAFREHSPSQGRWISPDPAGVAAADPASPQSWNRYAYVRNNPMSAIDPLGLDCVTANEDGSISINGGDCPGNDVNNEYYYNCDGCLVGATSAIVDQYGALILAIGQAYNGAALFADIGNDVNYTAPQSDNWLDPNSTLGYAWNFTASFSTSLVSSAGWKAVYHSTVEEGGCDNLMFSTFAEGFNPLPSGGPDAGTALEISPKAVAQVGRTAATAYSVSQGLSVPLRSGLYRGLQSSTYGVSASIEEAAPYVQVGLAGADALYTAGSAAYDGECY